jgi:hypothetical protein
MKKGCLTILLFCYSLLSHSQLRLDNGFIFPVNTSETPIHILLIPVELHGGECDKINNQPCFPPGKLPVKIDDYFDAQLLPGGPQKYFSKYLYQASFGKLIVLADYLDSCVHVDYCPGQNPSSPLNWTRVVNEAIKKQFPDFPLHHKTPISQLDQYALSNIGEIMGKPKLPVEGGNGRFDCVIYLIKNYPGYGGANGFGENVLGTTKDLPFDMGIDQGAVFGHTGDISSIKFIMEEFFHGMFGGNNWHGGAGKSNHTFMNRPSQWGIESQNGSSQVVSGYDRWLFNWTNPPDKNLRISARDSNNVESLSDLKIPKSPIESIFVLRDFVTTGDAVRIKLPHINCSSRYLESDEPVTGEEKNNYLWIENHRLLAGSIEDQNLNYSLSQSDFCGEWPVCGKFWSPGLFCIVQVGKDDEEGGNEIYSGRFNDPNTLASWMFPLTSSGYHDYKYGNVYPSGPECVWNNAFIPFDFTRPENTIPNPFCGYSRMWGTVNTDSSDMLHDNDAYFGSGYLDNDPSPKTLHYERSQFGDEYSSFRCNGDCGGGKEILSLSTNPSPVPLMTLTSNDNFKKSLRINPNYQDPRSHNFPNAYLNRTIYLNGISISILNENYKPEIFGNGAVRISVRWDKYNVINDVRWCADSIRLSPNDFNQSDYSLNIKNGSTVLIDRSLSPTYDYRDSLHENFTVPTVFTCLGNSRINVEDGGKIIVDNKSIFEMNDSSYINLRRKSEIRIKNGGRIVINAGAFIDLGNSKLIVEKGATMEFSKGAKIHAAKIKSALQVKGKLVVDGKEERLHGNYQLFQ